MEKSSLLEEGPEKSENSLQSRRHVADKEGRFSVTKEYGVVMVGDQQGRMMEEATGKN